MCVGGGRDGHCEYEIKSWLSVGFDGEKQRRVRRSDPVKHAAFVHCSSA